LLCKGVIYQKNASNAWYNYNSTVTTATSYWPMTGDPSATCPIAVPPNGASVTVYGAVKVVCPVTPANLLGAINSSMNCAVTISNLSVSSP
jgi:hypothetical protein